MIINFLSSLDRFFEDISSLPTASAIVNFIASSVTSYLAFQIYIELVSSHDDLSKRFAAIRKIKKDFGWDYHSFMTLYSCLTGLLTASFIYIQFKGGLNIQYAILYGTLGPYILRKKLSKFIDNPIERQQVVSSYYEEIDTIDQEVEQTNDRYQQELREIQQELVQNDTGV